MVVDAAGGGEVAQLGSPHRLKTIFRTNMNTAFAHGTYQAHARNTKSRPYWMYVAVMDSLTRPSHAAMHGRVFRYDDPIWQTHYPPNGFNCRCRVDALTAAEVEAMGLVIESSEGRLRDVTLEAGVDKRTGEVITVPGKTYSFAGKDGKQRVMTPDPGWNYNPGAAGDRSVSAGGAP